MLFYIHSSRCYGRLLRSNIQQSSLSISKPLPNGSNSHRFAARALSSWEQPVKNSFDRTQFASSLVLCTGVLSLPFLFQTSECDTTKCDESYSKTNIRLIASEKDIEAFVDHVLLSDPTINMTAIPDVLERKIYTSTVRLTLNALYYLLSKLHGTSLFAHSFQLHLARSPDNVMSSLQKRRVVDIDEEILQQVADRLLSNPAINQRYFPDVLERQLYVNCLKLLFTLLDTIFSTLRVTLCGHELSIHLEPAAAIKEQEGSVLMNSMTRAAVSSSLTAVDLEALEHFARKAGIGEDDIPPTGLWGWLTGRTSSAQREMMVQLHTSLYALILGIIDDLLANTEIAVLSDRIIIDIVPDEKYHKKQQGRAAEDAKETESTTPADDIASEVSNQETVPVQALIMSSFIMGVGVGSTVAAAVLMQQPRG